MGGCINKDSIKIGSITCCYNAGKYFKDCLNGLLSQTRKLNYIAVIDDGSSDDSWQKILQEIDPSLDSKKSHHDIEKNGINFFLLQLDKNYGPSYARNIGLSYLKDIVEIVAIADCDDIYYLKKVEKSIDILLKYPEVSLVYSDYDIEDLSKGTKQREYKEPFSFRRLSEECIVSNNSIFASKIINTIGGYSVDLRYGEDFDLWTRMSEISCLYHLPEALYSYRLTGENSTVVTSPEKFAEQVNKVYQKASERRGKR